MLNLNFQFQKNPFKSVKVNIYISLYLKLKNYVSVIDRQKYGQTHIWTDRRS